MNIKINQKSPLGIKDQIKRQIRSLILSGEYAAGQALPSARDLAATLGVNRNTVWFAYRDLAAQGMLEMVRGAGTFVSPDQGREDISALHKIFDQTLSKGASLGFDPDQITDYFLNYLSARSGQLSEKRVLVVECNQETLDRIAQTLDKELGVQTRKTLIQTLESDPSQIEKILAQVDLVVCGFNHLQEFRSLAPKSPVPALGLMLLPDIQLVKEMMRLPAGTRVGFVCANQRSTETLYRNQIFSSGSSLNRMLVGMDAPHKIKEMLDQCDVIFASFAAYEKIRRVADNRKKIIKVDVTLDPAGIEIVRHNLALMGNNNAINPAD